MAEALQPDQQAPVEIAPSVTGQPQDAASSAVADTAAVPAPVPAPELAVEQPAAVATAPAVPPAGAAPSPLVGAPAVPVPVVPAPQAAAAELAAPVAEVAPATPAPAPATEPVSVAAGEGLVQVNFSDDCWTQVTDANGRVLVSTVKRKGETLQVAGKAPLEVRLGFARGASVSYNGAPVNLRNVTSGGTARVTLGQ
ncbi:Cytoskeleton protein RodZ [compost metagenome]